MYRVFFNSDLGAAIYMNHDPALIRNSEFEALEFFTRLTTFYEQHTVFHQQRQDLQQGKTSTFLCL